MPCIRGWISETVLIWKEFAEFHRAAVASNRKQRFELGSHFVKHASWGLVDKPRSALLPRNAAQLIGLHNAADLMAIRNGHVKTPIAISPRNRAGDTATGQLIKGVRRQDKCRPPSRLFIRNRLLEIEPDYIARIGTIRDHFTMPHCRAARPNRPLAARCPGSSH